MYHRPVNPETGERVVPSELKSHRRTHYFVPPCCLCAPVLSKMYVESYIAIVHIPSGRPGALLNGSADTSVRDNLCYSQRWWSPAFCLVPLERLFSLKLLHLKCYEKHYSPLPAEQSAYITDFNLQLQELLDLYQALPVGTIFCRGDKKELPVETLLKAMTVGSNFVTLWSKGLREDDFWQLFLPRAICKTVMLWDVFSAFHADLCKNDNV
ncbi:hypothetical protein BKA70DRAFT_1233586 [Coprinopsis sp. MPI-PUGE-AT-0042]|nr:hypothetical protein BKA70DRAFT_1239217 [Coprinopsis sp. MPI-PUGE-AT-0042]KAH6892856.1 hypothetical protein BKA70DRAFT_1233586 [Coprinopsis sp. MPI-PUGE-AT-0042]